MAPDDAAPRTTLDSVAATVAGSLGALAEEMMLLSDQTSSLLRRFEQERVRVQRFIDHFAVGSLLAEQTVGRPVGDFATTEVNRSVVRRDVDNLDHAIARGQLLHGRLLASHRVLRELRTSFEDGRWDADIDSTADVRFQQATLAAREDERGRLAREIHDGPAQVLANAIFAVEIAEQVARRDPARVADELTQLRTLLKDGIAEMRRFMADLRPAMLADRGLVPTLSRYVTDYNRFFGRDVTFTAEDVPETLSSEQQLAVFRIVQEGLQNIQKHAGTGAASVVLRSEAGALVLTIVDEGAGFDPSRHGDGGGQGAGLPGMRERASLIGADFSIDSAAGSGTTIRLALPLSTSAVVTAADLTSNGSRQ